LRRKWRTLRRPGVTWLARFLNPVTTEREEKQERDDEEESEGSGGSDSQQGTKLRRLAASTEPILSLLVPLAGVVVKQVSPS
uniref:MADF domain-containing protein n=1 Tax=Haemonchus placei TaxID=6290 RepID=A0A158QRX4_HAEPC